MMSVGRVGDYAGGFIIDGSFSVFVNDLPVAVVGSYITPHASDPVHKDEFMITGFPAVLVEDSFICRTSDVASCGHVLMSYSNVEAG